MSVVLAAVACGVDAPAPEQPTEPPALVPAPATEVEPCVDLACRACASGAQCADVPDVADTCCATGDNLLHVAVGSGSEVVDAATDGAFAVMCGGFGAAVSDIRDPGAPVAVGGATRRCQNAAFGPVLEDGTRVFYATHHGDSWVATPSLQTFAIHPDATVTNIDRLEDTTILFEGLTYHDGFVYVAAHSKGVLVFEVGDGGELEQVGVVPGFDNAIEVAADGDSVYVADRVTGIHVLALDDPESPQRVQAAQTNGNARDLAIADGRLFVALGSAGIDVYDVSTDGLLQAAAHLASDGAAQQVDADAGLLAVAAWSHVALYDAETLTLLATERTRPTPEFEQDLGVAIHGTTVVAGEWEAMHLMQYRPGYVGPDIAIEQELLEFDSATPGRRAVVVRNRGALPLDIAEVRSNASSFAPESVSTSIPPGGGAAFEVAYEPGGPDRGLLEIFSNDPDDDQAPFAIWLDASVSTDLGVGDALTPAFGFLDIEGTGDVTNLQGDVIVLAYFALF